MRKSLIKTATILIKAILLPTAVYLLLSGLISVSYAREKPQAVSLDYCADQFILSLADREQIMALTRKAVQPHSFYKDKAQGLPMLRVSSEKIIHMAPDVVIRNWGGVKMLPLLDRANIPVASTEYGTGPKMLYQNMRLIGTALKQSDRAEEMIQNHKDRLINLTEKVAHSQILKTRLRAVYITPGGVTAGANTFINDILKLAGLTSISEELNLEGWQPLPLETLIQNPPDIIIGSFFHQKNIHVSNWSLTRHNRIKMMLDTIPTIMVPSRYLSCNGIFSIDAAEYIHDKIETLSK